MKAADIMTSEVVTIRGSATVAEATQLMKQRNLRALIVDRRHEEDAFGIVTATDVIYKVTAYGLDPKTVQVYEIMTKPCIVVNPELQVEYCRATESGSPRAENSRSVSQCPSDLCQRGGHLSCLCGGLGCG
jgi:CBS domain-containing protein